MFRIELNVDVDELHELADRYEGISREEVAQKLRELLGAYALDYLPQALREVEDWADENATKPAATLHIDLDL